MPTPLSISPPALRNRFFHLEIYQDAGPRISAIIPAGSTQNLLAELPEVQWDSPYGPYHPYGGHRLWAAPEIPEVMYFPEDTGVKVELLADGVLLSRVDDGAAHYERSFEVHVEQNAPRVHLLHTLRNLAKPPLKAAPWALTVLPVGARVLVPLTMENADGNPFLPNRNLILWPYTDPADPRFNLQQDAVSLTSNPARGPIKIGAYSTRGWAAAQVGGWLLIKRFTPLPMEGRLDLGANVEVYTNQTFLELETLGELRTMREGEYVQHEETWDVLPGKLEDLDADGRLTAQD